MKRVFGFGSFNNNTICMGIFITSFLIIFRFLYFYSVGFSIENIYVEKIIFYFFKLFYFRLEPLIFLIWLKFVCEFLFKCLNRN